MPVKAPVRQKARAHKKASRKQAKKPKQLACSDCGLVLTVDEMCGCPDLSGVICCGKPMKKKR